MKTGILRRMVMAASVVILCSACLPVVFAADQQWEKVYSEIKAKYSGFDKDVADMETDQTMSIATEKGSINSKVKLFKKGKLFRAEASLKAKDMPEGVSAGESVTIYDGTDIWLITPMMEKQKLTQKGQGLEYQMDKWWDMVSGTGKITGKESINGKECYVVEIEPVNGQSLSKLWIDKQTLNTLKAESKGTDNQVTTFIFSDLRKIKNNWEMAYKTEIFKGGKSFMVMTITSIKVNQNLPSALFDPSSVKAKEVPGAQDMIKKLMVK